MLLMPTILMLEFKPTEKHKTKFGGCCFFWLCKISEDRLTLDMMDWISKLNCHLIRYDLNKFVNSQFAKVCNFSWLFIRFWFIAAIWIMGYLFYFKWQVDFSQKNKFHCRWSSVFHILHKVRTMWHNSNEISFVVYEVVRYIPRRLAQTLLLP